MSSYSSPCWARSRNTSRCIRGSCRRPSCNLPSTSPATARSCGSPSVARTSSPRGTTLARCARRPASLRTLPPIVKSQVRNRHWPRNRSTARNARMNVSCTKSSRSASGAPALARKRASARAWRRTSSAAACSSPPCQAAISAASVGTAATGSAWGMALRTVDEGVRQILRLVEVQPPPLLNSPVPESTFTIRTRVRTPMRPYEQRLEHLVARAAAVFAEKGYHSTTMRDLAAASGMSLAGMYYYVRGKEELLYLVQERCFSRVLEGARGALTGLDDPVERLQAFIRHHVTCFAHHMAEMKVLSHEANGLTGDMKRRVNAIKRRYVDLLEGLLKDAAPEERPVDRSAAAYALFGMMNWIYNWYDLAGETDPQRLADLIARIFVGGFAEARSTVEGG